MLELKSVTVSAGNFRLQDIDLTLAEGECHAVLGPSGSGKTTLLNTVLGVLSPERGRIRLDGVDITDVSVERRGLGYVPQNLGLFPHLSVRDNLAYSPRARGLSRTQFQPMVDTLVEATGIGALLDRQTTTLSSGERQRVGLVRALASQPRLVLLDEPFTALNESLRRELWWLMRELRQQHGLTVMIVTHDLTEAYFLADNVSVLLEGRVIQQGEKAAVYGRPVSPAVAHFLGVETLQPGRVMIVKEGLATVEVGGAQLLAIAPPGVREHVLVSIRGEDVILQRGAGEISSARNRLPARVVSVQPGSPLMGVELDAGFPLFALVTRPAYEEMNLRPGDPVTAIIKAPSVHLIVRTP
jgi:molybdopterin-binding protein